MGAVADPWRRMTQKKKDAADRMLMVDMFSFALDHCKADMAQSTGVVLISNDIDFFYTLKTLKEKGFSTGLLHDIQVSSELLNAVHHHEQWLSCARGVGLRTGGRQKMSDVDKRRWTEKIRKVISTLRRHRFEPDEGYVRAQVKLEGKANDLAWQSVRQIAKEILAEEREQFRRSGSTEVMYHPRKPSKGSFSKNQLDALYSFLLDHPLAKKKGLFTMAKWIRTQSAAENRVLVHSMPLGMICEFVALAKERIWITGEGSALQISDCLINSMDDFEDESSEGELSDVLSESDDDSHWDLNSSDELEESEELIAPGLSPLMKMPASTGKAKPVKRNFHPAQAKGLLQYYFQVQGLGLPEYKSKSAGAHHTLSWESTVCVSLPEKGKQFFAKATHEKKKEAEKAAAHRACSVLFNHYLPNFVVPTQYII